MKLIIGKNETISVNKVIKRGIFPQNLRIKRIHNSNNLFVQFLPIWENDYRPFAGRCKEFKGKRIFMKKSMGTDNLLEAANRAIIWIEEIDEKGKQVKINKEKKKIHCIITGKFILRKRFSFVK